MLNSHADERGMKKKEINGSYEKCDVKVRRDVGR
jgi:hypothetical protein